MCNRRTDRLVKCGSFGHWDSLRRGVARIHSPLHASLFQLLSPCLPSLVFCCCSSCRAPLDRKLKRQRVRRKRQITNCLDRQRQQQQKQQQQAQFTSLRRFWHANCAPDANATTTTTTTARTTTATTSLSARKAWHHLLLW